MIQSIVSTDEATLYLDIVVGPQEEQRHHHHQHQVHLLTILLHPNDSVYILDLRVIGGGRGLDTRQDFALVQLEANLGRNDLARRKSLEVGMLPSLRGVLESPSVAKVVFNSTRVAAALKKEYGVSLRGVTDLQLMEQTGRQPSAAAAAAALMDPRLAFHRKFTVTPTTCPTSRHDKQELRDLRTCLE